MHDVILKWIAEEILHDKKAGGTEHDFSRRF